MQTSSLRKNEGWIKSYFPLKISAEVHGDRLTPWMVQETPPVIGGVYMGASQPSY